MNRETLVAEVENCKKISDEEHAKIEASIANALKSILVEAGVSDIAHFTNIDITSSTLSINRLGKQYGREMSIYIHKPYNLSQKDKKRVVELNVGTFGSFSSIDVPEMNFYIVAGAIAKNLPKLQEKIDAIDFTTYDESNSNTSKARYALDKFDSENREAEREKKVAELESKFTVGAKLRVGKKYDGQLIYDEIEKVTNKLIFLKHDYGTSTKKAKAIEFLMDGKWEFVA